MKIFKHRINSASVAFLLVYLFLLSIFLIQGCSKKKGSDSISSQKTGDAAVVARVGEGGINLSELKADLTAKPLPHMSKISEEDLQKRLDELILEEVLYQEALRLKLDQDPVVKKKLRQILTRKLMDEKIQKEVWGREIGSDELQEYYDEYLNEFNRSEQIRLGDIYLALPANATDHQMAAVKQKAEEVLAKAQAAKGDRFGFGRLVREYSDKHDKYRKGDTGYFDTEGKPLGLDPRLAEAAFALEKIGDMADHVIETLAGYHIIMLVSKRSAVHRSLDEVKADLERRIRREDLTRVRMEFIEGLKKKAGIQIYKEAIAGLAGEMEKEAQARIPLQTEKAPPRGTGARSGPPPFPRQ